MDIFAIIFLSCVSIIFGMILMIFLQYCVIMKYFKQSPTADVQSKPFTEAFCLPEALKKVIENENFNNEDSKHCSIPISLMMQFLFHELRHSDGIKRWLYKKLSLEFDELLTKTTTGKFFDAVIIRDMHLGSQFPDIKNISVENVVLDKNHGHIDVLNLCVQLDYTGHFLLSVDAKMKFGKTAYLSIKVKRVTGLARLQFTRLPYTHWSFSFYSDPLIELGVESQFQGRQLQSNITSLIINQIKKAIKRKHTLPNYKIRYKPFFNKTDPGQLDIDDYEILPQGILEITNVEVSRLSVHQDVGSVYCTFTIDTIPWVRLNQNQAQNLTYIIMDLTITKNRQQQLGVVFKQETIENKSIVTVETIVPNSPAFNAGLIPGDNLISVDSKPVNSMTQVAKVVKGVTTASFCVRVKRVVKNYIFTSKKEAGLSKMESISKSESLDDLDDISEDVSMGNGKKGNENDIKKPKSIVNLESRFKNSDKIPKILSSSNENVSKLAQTIGNFSLRKRKQSSERSSNDGSSKSTPNASNANTPQHMKYSTTSALIFPKKMIDKTISEDIISIKSDTTNSSLINSPEIECKNLSDLIECYEGPNQDLESVITFNDEHSFHLKETDKYLNINVWGKNSKSENDVLLGYANIPLHFVLNECCNSMLGHYINSFQFLPPDNTQPTSQSHPLLTHSGFEHCFCYGDILLSFMWISEDINNVKRKSVASIETPSREDSLKSQYSKHDFIRTQFHRTTHCDFCSKKIWLKDAVQCRNCALCCHKKCVLKCQTSTTCSYDSNLKHEGLEFSQPEITMTEVGDDQATEDINDPIIKQYSEQTFNGNGGLKRVNSFNSLTIPGAHTLPNSQSRSLPPSPQHTPGRKQSIVNLNPFSLCPGLLEACFNTPNDPSTGETMNQIIEQLLQCSQDENLMDAAKETGIQFYSSIPHEQRTDKINVLVTELKKILDTTTSEHMDLSKQLTSEENPTEKARLAFLMGQADAKVHALSVLMLHYCSGLQQVQEKIV